MGRSRKDGVRVNLYIKKDVNNKLDQFCEKTGMARSVAVERFIVSEIEKTEKGNTLVLSIDK